jgi:hypothetical protein
VCEVVHLLDYLLKASIITVLVVKGYNSPFSSFPNYLVADGDIDYHNLPHSDHPHQHMQQFMRSEGSPCLSVSYSIVFFPVVVLIAMVPILTSRDMYFIDYNIWQ